MTGPDSAPALAPHAWWLPLVGSLLAYGAAAGPHVYDAGELVAATWLLGGSHPPGQPLHAIVGHALTLFPLGPIPWRVALLSIAGGLVAAWLAGRVTGVLLERHAVRRSWTVRLAPDAIAFAVLVAPPVLRQLPRPEVYGIALALAVFGIAELVHWACDDHAGGAPVRRAGLAAGFLTGLHLPHALVVVGIGLLVVLSLRAEVWRSPRTIVWAAAAFGLGLAVHLYLPIRAHAGAPMWGRPDTLSGFFEYVSASAYRRNLGSGEGGLASNVAVATTHLVRSTGFVPAFGALLGVVLARRRTTVDKRIGYATIAAVPVAVAPALMQPLNVTIADQVAYLGPAVALLIALGGAGFANLAGTRASATATAGLGLALIAFNPVGISQLPRQWRAYTPALESLQGALTDTPSSRSLVVTETDFTSGSWMMARAVDAARPDVALLVTGLSTSSWHWRSLAAHPAFDGRALRTRQPDPENPYAPFVHAAIRHARTLVPVATEPGWPVGDGGRLAGPYLLLPPEGQPARTRRDPTSIGERLASHIDREARDAAGSAEAGVLRGYQLQRIRRLAARGLLELAGKAAVRLDASLPAPQRRVLRSLEGKPERPLPHVVREPAAPFRSPQDAVREIAALLWSAGEPEAAIALLEHQMQQGDPRSLLQLAWLHLDAGHPERATRARDAFAEQAPDLAGEARPLSRRLRSAP